MKSKFISELGKKYLEFKWQPIPRWLPKEGKQCSTFWVVVYEPKPPHEGNGNNLQHHLTCAVVHGFGGLPVTGTTLPKSVEGPQSLHHNKSYVPKVKHPVPKGLLRQVVLCLNDSPHHRLVRAAHTQEIPGHPTLSQQV